MISAGELTERVTIQVPTTTQNEVGESTIEWDTFATVWAKVSDLSGREAERYGEMVGLGGLKVTIRSLPGVSTRMRVLYRGRTLEVGSISEYDRIWYQELFCTETSTS